MQTKYLLRLVYVNIYVQYMLLQMLRDFAFGIRLRTATYKYTCSAK